MESQVNQVFVSPRENTTILDTKKKQDEHYKKMKKHNLWSAIIHEAKDAGEFLIFKYLIIHHFLKHV
jgi:hypothetical protein